MWWLFGMEFYFLFEFVFWIANQSPDAFTFLLLHNAIIRWSFLFDFMFSSECCILAAFRETSGNIWCCASVKNLTCAWHQHNHETGFGYVQHRWKTKTLFLLISNLHGSLDFFSGINLVYHPSATYTSWWRGR